MRRSGFTLIELLVAVGIIVLLIAIALPVLSLVKKKSQESDSRAQLMAIRASVEGYFNLFRAYPGPMLEERLTRDMGWTAPQNLSLGLLGSIQTGDREFNNQPQLSPRINWGGSQYARVPLPVYPGQEYRAYATEEPRGVYDLADGVQHAPFYSPRKSELRVAQGLATPSNPWPNTSTTAHTAIPVLFDRFGDALPILYFRRDTTFVTPVVADTYITPGVGAGAAYYRLSNAAFVNSTTLQASSGTVCSQATSGYNTANISTAVTAPFSTHLEEAMTDLTSDFSTPATRKPRNMFVLISAGLDRVYGPRIEGGQKVAESDDIVVVGGGGS